MGDDICWIEVNEENKCYVIVSGYQITFSYRF